MSLRSILFLVLSLISSQILAAELVQGEKNNLKGFLRASDPLDGPSVLTFAEPYKVDASRIGSEVNAYTELVKYLLPSPNQNEAGSCLYMATTGNLEWWLNKRNNSVTSLADADGKSDLSERYLMNLSNQSIAQQVSNQLTDLVYLVRNNNNNFYLNSDYRYTKGWYKSVNGVYQKAQPNESGASFDTTYNWIDESKNLNSSEIRIPEFDREIIFKDPNNNRWAINTMPDDIVATIKKSLKDKQAPVLVIYNHYLVWHAVMIVGYDDEAATNNCKFTNGFVDYVKKEAEKAKLAGQLEKAKRLEKQSEDVRLAQLKEGGCAEKGVFLVRDSIYESSAGNIYDYVKGQTGDEEPYSELVVKKEYQWLKRFGNHAYIIFPK